MAAPICSWGWYNTSYNLFIFYFTSLFLCKNSRLMFLSNNKSHTWKELPWNWEHPLHLDNLASISLSLPPPCPLQLSSGHWQQHLVFDILYFKGIECIEERYGKFWNSFSPIPSKISGNGNKLLNLYKNKMSQGFLFICFQWWIIEKTFNPV